MEKQNEKGSLPEAESEEYKKQEIRRRAERLARKTVRDFSAKDVGTYASSIAFFFFMSLIPLLIIMLQMIPYVGLSQTELLEFIYRLVPETTKGFARVVVSEAYKNASGTMSLSALVLVWAASTGTMALRSGLNRVYDVEETRPFPLQVLLAIAYTAALLILFAIMLVGVFIGPVTTYLSKVMPEIFNKPVTIQLHDRFLITLFMLVIFVLIYTYIPAGKRSFFRQIPGALLVAVVWNIFSRIFSIYVRGYNAYTMFYGSLGGIAILLFWLYCSFFILLIGAFFNRFCGARWDRVKRWVKKRWAKKKEGDGN